MNKRQVNTQFKKVVKIIKEGNFKTLEQIEDIINDTFKFEYCDGDENYTSYLVDEYEGKITKKDITDKDFKETDTMKTYIDIVVENNNIEIGAIIFVNYFDKWNFKHSESVELYSEKINL